MSNTYGNGSISSGFRLLSAIRPAIRQVMQALRFTLVSPIGERKAVNRNCRGARDQPCVQLIGAWPAVRIAEIALRSHAEAIDRCLPVFFAWSQHSRWKLRVVGRVWKMMCFQTQTGVLLVADAAFSGQATVELVA